MGREGRCDDGEAGREKEDEPWIAEYACIPASC